ncbi:hypothetical protein I4U23_031270 [Adineta vaga]|nr:hypothetical protein I4U23_031270 [Adineta vaga]
MLIFEELSTEIYYEIFDYLSSNDIISTFFDLNQRFNRIIMNYSRYLHHFITPIKNLSFWKRILPEINSQIQCLTITQINSYFSLNLFPNIQCLILSCPLPIYDDEFDLIIKINYFSQSNESNEIIAKKRDIIHSNHITSFSRIFNLENSLNIFESLSEFNRYFRLKMILNLQSLSMKLMDIGLFLYLLKFTPNLKYLNIIISVIGFTNQLFIDENFSHIKLEKISLSFENCAFNEKIFLSLFSFIKQFSSSLISLSLNSSRIPLCNYEINGFILYEQLLKSMIKLQMKIEFILIK